MSRRVAGITICLRLATLAMFGSSIGIVLKEILVGSCASRAISGRLTNGAIIVGARGT